MEVESSPLACSLPGAQVNKNHTTHFHSQSVRVYQLPSITIAVHHLKAPRIPKFNHVPLSGIHLPPSQKGQQAVPTWSESPCSPLINRVAVDLNGSIGHRSGSSRSSRAKPAALSGHGTTVGRSLKGHVSELSGGHRISTSRQENRPSHGVHNPKRGVSLWFQEHRLTNSIFHRCSKMFHTASSIRLLSFSFLLPNTNSPQRVHVPTLRPKPPVLLPSPVRHPRTVLALSGSAVRSTTRRPKERFVGHMGGLQQLFQHRRQRASRTETWLPAEVDGSPTWRRSGSGGAFGSGGDDV